MKILVFTSSNCPHCPNAERIVREVVPKYEIHGVSHEKIRRKHTFDVKLCTKYL